MSVKTSKKNYTGYSVCIDGPSQLVYSPEKPLGCGAVLWVQTKAKVILELGNEIIEIE